ncbi:MAG: hypothetical protein L6R40_003585 [Gallowayella cf. fulva]|nr:MAG: hypothetical protein L6R40_003585 [Xanthomendoza cf. fulva]
MPLRERGSKFLSLRTSAVSPSEHGLQNPSLRTQPTMPLRERENKTHSLRTTAVSPLEHGIKTPSFEIASFAETQAKSLEELRKYTRRLEREYKALLSTHADSMDEAQQEIQYLQGQLDAVNSVSQSASVAEAARHSAVIARLESEVATLRSELEEAYWIAEVANSRAQAAEDRIEQVIRILRPSSEVKSIEDPITLSGLPDPANKNKVSFFTPTPPPRVEPTTRSEQGIHASPRIFNPSSFRGEIYNDFIPARKPSMTRVALEPMSAIPPTRLGDVQPPVAPGASQATLGNVENVLAASPRPDIYVPPHRRIRGRTGEGFHFHQIG